MQEECIAVIAKVGEAKSYLYMAIELAEAKKKEEANKYYQYGESLFQRAGKEYFTLNQKREEVDDVILYLHMEKHVSQCELLLLMASKLLKLYQTL